jgi:hypothetical protein
LHNIIGYWIHAKQVRRSWKEHEEEQWQAVENRAWMLSKGLTLASEHLNGNSSCLQQYSQIWKDERFEVEIWCK